MGIGYRPRAGQQGKGDCSCNRIRHRGCRRYERTSQKHTEEETRRIAEQEEKRAEREDRRKHYYGSDGNTPQYKRHPHIFLFRPEDLDNEDVIMQVEDTPTYKRTRQMLEDIRHIASGQQETTKKEEGDEPVKGVISFA